MLRYHRGWMVAGCADVGIRGNAHMMMLEKNNQEIAGFIAGWAGKNIR